MLQFYTEIILMCFTVHTIYKSTCIIYITLHYITCSPTLTTKCLSTSGLPKQNQHGPLATGGLPWSLTHNHNIIKLRYQESHLAHIALDHYLQEGY